MSIGPTLPPQAYTREILAVAFNWLQGQPESIRKMAVTPDTLVGLYMRAQRFGASSGEGDAPVSSQNFKTDLKNLAEGLRQFEDGTPDDAPFQPIAEEKVQAPRWPDAASPLDFAASSQGTEHCADLGLQSGSRAALGVASMRAEDPTHQVQLTATSASYAREMRERLNLSSESEAVNMMLAVAYKSLQNLLR